MDYITPVGRSYLCISIPGLLYCNLIVLPEFLFSRSEEPLAWTTFLLINHPTPCSFIYDIYAVLFRMKPRYCITFVYCPDASGTAEFCVCFLFIILRSIVDMYVIKYRTMPTSNLDMNNFYSKCELIKCIQICWFSISILKKNLVISLRWSWVCRKQ